MADTDLATLAQVKQHLNIPTGTTTHDSELSAFIESITAVIEQITGPVVLRQVVERHHGGQRHVTPLRPPVESITSVTEDGEAVAADGYVLSDAGLLYRSSGRWYPGTSNVEVTYQAGRVAATADVPASIRHAALDLLAVNWRPQQGGNASVFDVGGADEGTVRLGFFVPNRVVQLCAPYQMWAGVL